MKRILLVALVGFLSLLPRLEAVELGAFTGEWEVTDKSTPIGAELQKLAVIRSNRDSNEGHLSLALDNQDRVLGISFETRQPGTPPVVTGDYFFPMADIASPRGVVLITSGSHKAVLLQGTIAQDHGSMVVSYLANGISGTYKNCQVKLERTGREWILINAYTGMPVRDVFVRTYNFGIRNIEGICPN